MISISLGKTLGSKYWLISGERQLTPSYSYANYYKSVLKQSYDGSDNLPDYTSWPVLDWLYKYD